ncbi:MAG: UDP-4-amino-4,6-dideoxy-N-acetyl-beta-L-altrosamine transaminase [Desulfobacteraceae bacterium]|nr:UDP-4-amino-4,6-dideoxy-N-acetyl-beta-L-altrosamine transaminase [Desulfobacteraceae bacterium]
MTFIPYGRQLIDEEDIKAVGEVLRSDWLTTGPMVGRFEQAVCAFTGARFCVAVSSGTAALHATMSAIGIGPGDEVIVPAITFVATANAVVYTGAKPVFADVDSDTLLIDPVDVARKITPMTRAVIAVDYAGQPCDYDALRAIADGYGIALVADACHALGAKYKGRGAGTLADMTCFSFHPVKHITTGEGGMIATDDEELAKKMRRFRNHGVMTDQREREAQGTWRYDMVELGFNYRLSDMQCALGVSQVKKLPVWLERRKEIASLYDKAFSAPDRVSPLAVKAGVDHAYHLYVVRLAGKDERQKAYDGMRRQGIGVNVHYLPVYLHSYYRQRFGTSDGLCPRAEAAYGHILTLPIHQGMEDEDAQYVASSLRSFMS